MTREGEREGECRTLAATAREGSKSCVYSPERSDISRLSIGSEWEREGEGKRERRGKKREEREKEREEREGERKSEREGGRERERERETSP